MEQLTPLPLVAAAAHRPTGSKPASERKVCEAHEGLNMCNIAICKAAPCSPSDGGLCSVAYMQYPCRGSTCGTPGLPGSVLQPHR